MTLLNSNKWLEWLNNSLPVRLRTFLHTGARSQLLKQVNTVLMVHEDKLYDLANGSWRQLSSAALQGNPSEIAQAAVDLLSQVTNERAVLLLLPSTSFFATKVNLPGVARESFMSALRLQSAMVLPSYEEPLVFAANTAQKLSDTDVVVWTNEAKLDALFDAFASNNLFLTAVMPRALAAGSQSDRQDNVEIEDEDATTLTSLRYQNGLLINWQQVEKSDLEQDAFAQQWNEAKQDWLTEGSRHMTMRSAQDYLELPVAVSSDPDYSFLPGGAQAAIRQMEKGKRLLIAAAAAGIVLFLSALPFLFQSIQARGLIATLEDQRELAADARTDQAMVRDFEQQWGVLNEFPRQQIPDTLLELQTALNPSVLTSLEIEEGAIQIEGESPDPQSLLETLEQDPMFTGVDFARATNNNRYYIDLRLSTVDFDGYWQRYFPDARR